MSRSDLQRRRSDRARGGSRRERDREALAQQRQEEEDARRESLVAATTESDRAGVLWGKVLEQLAEQRIQPRYFEPLVLLGEANGALHLQAPRGYAHWLERRVGRLLGNLARELGTNCKGIYITEAPPTQDEKDRLL